MPELSRFYGIVIRMYSEPESSHHKRHFHAYYQGEVAIYAIDEIQLIAGSIPLRQRRLVEAWAELHQYELVEAWQLLQSGLPTSKINPLK